jgi:hypothetical protein
VVDTSGIQEATMSVEIPDTAQAVRQKLEIALRKKRLEVEQDAARELLRAAAGKGRIIDIRV